MKYLKIQNDGLLDVRLVSLMGGTTKSNDQFKIGHFGTGLKYAFAYLFRNNIDFKLFVGNDQIQFGLESERIQETDFEIICITGHRTSITTRMGNEWNAWMIIRELWCNALDEGGSFREVTSTVEGKENCTTFYIQITPDIQQVLTDWSKYFMHDQVALESTKTYAIYPGGNEVRIFKKGVLIKSLTKEGQRPLFSYDVLDADINELREFRGTIDACIAKIFATMSVEMCRYVLENITRDSYESNLDLAWFTKWSDNWVKAIGERKIISYEVHDQAVKVGIAIDPTKFWVVPKNMFSEITKQHREVSGVRQTGRSQHTFLEVPDEATERMVMHAKNTLIACGYHMRSELSFKYGYFENPDTLAQLNVEKKEIYISNLHGQRDLFDVATTLVEENEHFNTGMHDHTRAFQQHFINLYTKQLFANHNLHL